MDKSKFGYLNDDDYTLRLKKKVISIVELSNGHEFTTLNLKLGFPRKSIQQSFKPFGPTMIYTFPF